MSRDRLGACRAILFVPGDRSDRFDRALASGADAVVIDLEDAVAEADKDMARKLALRFLERRPGGFIGLRINALATRAGIQDLAALSDSPALPGFVALSKVESAAEVTLCARILGERHWVGELLCAIETALGLERATEIASAHPNVTGLGFGGVDLAAELGAELAWEPMLAARARVICAAAVARISAFDVPCLDLDSSSMLVVESRRARAMGFAGKLAIHPNQLAVIRSAFTPTATELAAARALLADAADGRAVRIRGAMVDAGVLRRARRVLDRAAEGSGV
jgi:(S)-citramalyl-CoA lyase